MKALKWFLSWFAAVLITAGLGSVVQTQFNLYRLQALGVPIGWMTRLETTASDLLGFAPVWAIIVALGLLIALFSASFLASQWPAGSRFLHVLAGFAAPLAALLIMEVMLPVTPVAAARNWAGVVAISLPGALGGWVYARLWCQRQKGHNLYQAAQR